MAHDDDRQERDDFEPTITRSDPDRVEPDRSATDSEEHTGDMGDASDPRVQQPGE